jgi:hypothetical protein
MFIIDSINFVRKCPHCNMFFYVYVYGEWPDVRASFDSVTDLPICATVDNIEKFVTYINVFSEPRLGKTFICGVNYERFEKTNRYFIMDCINAKIDGRQTAARYGINLFIDNKPAVCCCTIDDKSILINSDGHIIYTEVVYSKTGDAFKIGNGYLISTHTGIRWGSVWQYISAPALNTKPAVASASGFDE